MRRVMLIGLDCLAPRMAFERYHHAMPCFAALMRRGIWSRLQSTMPPITVPAWTSMVSGRDPGELGIYGFRKRSAGRYDLSLVSSEDIQCERVWDMLARHGKRAAVLFVPPSFPVQALPSGILVSCFLTPDPDQAYTYPASLRGELEARFGPYIPDVEVRLSAREGLLAQLSDMTRQHFAIARHVWETREPDFMMMVEIGPDRLHHAFFADMEPSHPRHDPESPFLDVGERYYRLLDEELASLVALADDDTLILVASDHGARPLHGCFHINEWLIQAGWLRLREPLRAAQPLTPELVDWAQTAAWAEGGYYARVFLNLRGREPCGSVDPAQADGLRETLRQRLLAVRGPAGQLWQNRVETPQALYGDVRGQAPDLLAIFDDLGVRPLATVGSGTLYAERDDRGADACNHDWSGVFVAAGPGVRALGRREDHAIYDVGATVLGAFGLSPPAGFRGRDVRSAL